MSDFSNLTNNSIVILDALNLSFYTRFKLITKLYVDSPTELQSPVFKNFKFSYTPAPEIIADNYSFVKSDSVFNDGDTMDISINYGNFGFAQANGILNKWFATSPMA